MAQAAMATTGPNASQLCREAISRFSWTSGGCQHAAPSCNASASASGPRLLAGRQRQRLVGGHGLVPLVATLPADPLDDPLDLLGGDDQVGELHQVLAAALVGGVADAGIDDLVQQRRAVLTAVNAQA